MNKLKQFLFFSLLSSLFPVYSSAQAVQSGYSAEGSNQVFTLSNDKVTQKVFVRHNMLQGDELMGNKAWIEKYHNNNQDAVYTDGGYALQIMWAGWSAPGKQFNGDLQVSFTRKDYKYVRYDFNDIHEGGKELNLYFAPFDESNAIQLRITYQLLPDKFYAKRKIALQDTSRRGNWLEAFVSRSGDIRDNVLHTRNNDVQEETTHIIKKGEFGQPCAVDFKNGGAFFGIEYPAATNEVKQEDHRINLHCRELMGQVIRKDWVESDWVVEGLAPDHYIKDWFFNYLPDIRVAPTRPYTLYNSWYDLRSPEYPEVEPAHVMNEKNILNIINLFKKNMIDKYGINLDAFVLDDGWDVYESDWKMRTKTFPHGLKPVVDALKPLGTTLGIWLGPTGGYSFRMKRINWMRAHGYETIGAGSDDEMMDIAGPKYSALFEKRTSTFAQEGVGYFKWDGIQFSSSEPGSGHAVGYHSRRAAMESVIEKCKAVRAVNPGEFLNITSGTWMSPWWLKYANQIWMQGQDYGYADVPSVNERDGAITYKDFVLYNDLHNQDLWFPVSNLMTHGIIKGNLEMLGGNDDPLDKFANDAVFYFGRGVSMYEMYISPDLLEPREWEVLSKSLQWAKDRFPVLNKTYMTGGDPTKGEPYAYVHFNKDKGIIAMRNPVMQTQQITVQLDPAEGMADSASSLVLERTYPTHFIYPDLYAAGATITIPLQGYEAAIYEVYPLKDAGRPLLAGADFEISGQDSHHYTLHLLDNSGAVRLLNPAMAQSVTIDRKEVSPDHLNMEYEQEQPLLTSQQNSFDNNTITTDIYLNDSVVKARYIVLLNPDSTNQTKDFPDIVLKADGKTIQPTVQKLDGSWASYSFRIAQAGKHHFELQLTPSDKVKHWSGNTAVWLTAEQKQEGHQVQIITEKEITVPPMPPSPYAEGALMHTVLLGKGRLNL